MSRPAKLFLIGAIVLCVILTVSFVSSSSVPSDKKISVVAVAPHVKVAHCELTNTSVGRPKIYFSRGRRVSHSYYEKEELIYRYLYRFFKVRPVNQSIQEWGSPPMGLIQLTLALKMSEAQLARNAGIGVTITDVNGIQHGSDKGSFGGCAFANGWIIDWGLGVEAHTLVPPLSIIVTNGDGAVLIQFKAETW